MSRFDLLFFPRPPSARIAKARWVELPSARIAKAGRALLRSGGLGVSCFKHRFFVQMFTVECACRLHYYFCSVPRPFKFVHSFFLSPLFFYYLPVLPPPLSLFFLYFYSFLLYVDPWRVMSYHKFYSTFVTIKRVRVR